MGVIFSCLIEISLSFQLKGLTIIFAGQENPFIIFRRKEIPKEIYIYIKTNKNNPHKFAEI